MTYEILMIDSLDRFYYKESTALWTDFAKRIGVKFTFSNIQNPMVQPNYNKWLWPKVAVAETVLLVDSDTIPMPWCSEDILSYNTRTFNAAKTGRHENHLRQITNASDYISVNFEWDQCINSGVMVIRNNPVSRLVAENIIKFSEYNPLRQEQTYSQAYIASLGLDIGYLPSKYNFVYAGDDTLANTEYMRELCHIAHFPGYPHDERIVKMLNFKKTWA